MDKETIEKKLKAMREAGKSKGEIANMRTKLMSRYRAQVERRKKKGDD